MKKLKYITLLILLVFTVSCGGGSESNSDDGSVPMAPTPPPVAATLVFPENNTECNISEVLSSTQSTVPFVWNSSQNTDTYQISIRNLNTNTIVTSQVVTNPEADITLERGTPYEWSVESRANGTNETASSSLFRFFNEGPGIQNYAPFPANAINPSRGASISSEMTSVLLEWETNDIDNDPLEYEILFGITENPTSSIAITTETNISVDTTSGSVYFWRVISKDDQNNTSQSEIFSFRVL
ncbi:hypothetical protein [uncultured Croceitalea sp.]|uniref:hypothetical protein n=1 Tax=uncultured Croceitalea sp. TaxID=1798908 RepID=UPI00374F9072